MYVFIFYFLQLYISDDNLCANEFDFKKALDLLFWIDDPTEQQELKRIIWIKSILRNSWMHLDTDNPVQTLSDTTFFRTVELAFTQGRSTFICLSPLNFAFDI